MPENISPTKTKIAEETTKETKHGSIPDTKDIVKKVMEEGVDMEGTKLTPTKEKETEGTAPEGRKEELFQNRLDELKKKIMSEYHGGEAQEGMSSKEVLKKMKENGKYHESRPFFDSLPEELPVPTDIKEVKNDKTMTEKEMTMGQKFFTKNEAFGLACKNAKEGKDGVIWFTDDAGALCEVYVFDGGSSVRVVESFPYDGWNTGSVSFFRN